MKNTIEKIFLSKVWDISWITVGIILVSLSTYYSYLQDQEVYLLITSFLGGVIGLLVVNFYAKGRGRLGSGLGVFGACFDTFNNYQFGLLGNVFVGIYCAILYAKGFFTLGKKIKVTNITKTNLYVSTLIAIVGAVVIIFFGSSILPDNAPMWVIIMNIMVFIIQVLSQYLMVEGKAISWFGWIIANFINIALFLYSIIVAHESSAAIYLCLNIMYQLNSVKGILTWYSSKNQAKTNVPA